MAMTRMELPIQVQRVRANSSGVAANRFRLSQAPVAGSAVSTQNGIAKINPIANGAAHVTAVQPA